MKKTKNRNHERIYYCGAHEKMAIFWNDWIEFITCKTYIYAALPLNNMQTFLFNGRFIFSFTVFVFFDP